MFNYWIQDQQSIGKKIPRSRKAISLFRCVNINKIQKYKIIYFTVSFI